MKKHIVYTGDDAELTGTKDVVEYDYRPPSMRQILKFNSLQSDNPDMAEALENVTDEETFADVDPSVVGAFMETVNDVLGGCVTNLTVNDEEYDEIIDLPANYFTDMVEVLMKTAAPKKAKKAPSAKNTGTKTMASQSARAKQKS